MSAALGALGGPTHPAWVRVQVSAGSRQPRSGGCWAAVTGTQVDAALPPLPLHRGLAPGLGGREVGQPVVVLMRTEMAKMEKFRRNLGV